MAYAFIFRRPRTHVMRGVARVIHAIALFVQPPLMFCLVGLSFVGIGGLLFATANAIVTHFSGAALWDANVWFGAFPGGLFGAAAAAIATGEIGLRFIEQIVDALRL